jgi:hypothetical protein
LIFKPHTLDPLCNYENGYAANFVLLYVGGSFKIYIRAIIVDENEWVDI